MKHSRAGWLLILGVLACSPPGGSTNQGDAVVARLGDRTLDAADLVVTGEVRGETDPDALLKVAVGNVLAAVEARSRGLADDPARRAAIALIRARARVEEDSLLAQTLFETERAALSPSEDELRAHYDATKNRYLVRKMALRRVGYDSKEKAEAADRALGPDGHLDPAAAETISATEIQRLPAAVLPEATYLRRPGQRVVAGKEDEGWSLVELVDNVPADPSPFEDVRERVRDDFTALRAIERVSARVEELRAKANVEVEESALRDQAAFAALRAAAAAKSPTGPSRDRAGSSR
jgi:hypothetical protein